MYVAGGTSLLKTLLMEHSSVSGMTCTHKPEGEGQHLQSVYQPVKRLGGMDKVGACLHYGAA